MAQPNIRTKLEMRRTLCRCYDFFCAELSRDHAAELSERMESLRQACFEAMEKPTEAGLKSLRDGMGK